MKWGAAIGITAVVALMALYQWPKIGENQKKEKAAFAVLTAMGWVLAILLAFYRDLPGPTQLIDAIYHPLGKLIE